CSHFLPLLFALLFSFSLTRRPARSTLFPYTTEVQRLAGLLPRTGGESRCRYPVAAILASGRWSPTPGPAPRCPGSEPDCGRLGAGCVAATDLHNGSRRQPATGGYPAARRCAY